MQYKQLSTFIFYLLAIVIECIAFPLYKRAPSSSYSAHAIIIGIILILLGLYLTFMASRHTHHAAFLAGFYFWGLIAFIIMSNVGVSNATILLVVSLVVGVIGGIFVFCLRRIGSAMLGAVAGLSLGLWILAWKEPEGSISSSTGQAILLSVLVVVGFILGFIREQWGYVVAGSVVGAWSVFLGIDIFVRTGIVSFTGYIISGHHLAVTDSDASWKVYLMLAGAALLTLIGIFVQRRYWWSNAQPVTKGPVTTRRKRFFFF